jgi:hypothetical protein
MRETRAAVRQRLAVHSQQVVLGETEAADGCLSVKAALGPAPVISVGSRQQLGGALA